MQTDAELYVTPRVVTSLDECDFYHVMELPGLGVLGAGWDLRQGLYDYLGHVNVAGKRVLDVGSASGFLSFSLERLGAEVISYDLGENDSWDVVPDASSDSAELREAMRRVVRRVQNSYWYCHRVLHSQTRMVHGTAYTMPAALGPVDVSVCGSILLHLRDPFLALQNVCQRTRETIIVTEMMPRRLFPCWLLARLLGPSVAGLCGKKQQFLRINGSVWWYLPPRLIQQYLAVLGFEKTRVTFHRQPHHGSTRLLYTVAGTRTRPAPNLAPIGDAKEAA